MEDKDECYKRDARKNCRLNRQSRESAGWGDGRLATRCVLQCLK
jgi:hypothetical protein